MAAMQVFLTAMLAAAATAAPQFDISNNYLPPPETPPPDTYLPPPVTEPNPEYLPPVTEPNPEYLPPVTEPNPEYLPPPSLNGGDNLLQSGGGADANGGTAGKDCGVSDGSGQLDIRGGCSTSDVSDNSLGQGAGQSDNSLGQGADQSDNSGQGAGQSGGFDDGQYHPSGNSGQYNPQAGGRGPVGDDGQYHPESVTFPAIEDFEFAYAVKDEKSGNDYAVNESNKGGAYKIKLPDGRTQIVQYVIDSRGVYRSKITYLQADGSQ